MIKGTVAIIGRPNVGKSTLFNRLTKTKKSIVDDQPGVTRDRIYGVAHFDMDKTLGCTLVDTGGFETKDFNFQPFAENLVWKQTELAILEADLILLLFDGKNGLHQHDRELVHYLKLKNKKVIFVVNKMDGIEKQANAWEFYEIGVEELILISAAHNKGMDQLRRTMQDTLGEMSKLKEQLEEEGCTRIAIIGRPNAGKSSILNRLVGEDRALVSPIAGTTRDSVDTRFIYNQKPYLLIDTAGIRRRSKVKDVLEVESVFRSIEAIERSHVIVYVIDALAGITDQDSRLINLAMDRHKPLLLVVNKWDLVPDKTTHTAQIYMKNIHELILKEFYFIPMHFVSCTENQRVHKIMERVETLAEESKRMVNTAKINSVLQEMVLSHTPHLVKKYAKRVKFYYATQVSAEPPTIVIKTNLLDEIQDSYKRFMLKTFRKELGFEHVPIRMILRNKNEGKVRQSRKKDDDDEPVLAEV